MLRTARMVAGAPGTHISQTIDVINEYAPHGRVMALTLHLVPFFPAVTYTDTEWASAFGTVWPLIPAYAEQEGSNAPIRYHDRDQMPPLERYMFDRIIGDMVAKPPALIMLGRSLTDELYGDGRFNYMKYFSRDERFRRLMTNYRLLPVEGAFVYYARSDIAAAPHAPARGPRFGTRWTANCYNCLE